MFFYFRTTRARLRIASLFLCLSCTGTITGSPQTLAPPDDVPQAEGECAQIQAAAGVRELQRLTSRELDRTVADVLGDASHAYALRLGATDELIGAKQRYFRARSANAVWAEGAVLAAEEVAQTAAAKPGFSACAGDERMCARQFIMQVGRRLWRRTLNVDEIESTLSLYDVARTDASQSEAVATVLQSLLSAPHFFFFQQPSAEGSLGGTVLAEQLASTLWQQAPDVELLNAAEIGTLDSAQGLQDQVARLLADPRADDTFAVFLKAWLAPEKVATIDEALAQATRQPEVYSLFKSPGNGADGLAYGAALDSFLRAEARVETGTFENVMSSPKVAVNEAVARNLGLPVASTLELRSTESPRRRGILGQPAVLMAFGRFESSDPVHRGVFLLRHALCNDVPPPDANVNTTLPAAEAFNTTRDRFVAATKNGSCAGCHALINPLGFAFENFDAVGKFRTTENSHAVDARATLLLLPGAPQVDGLGELAQQLAQDPVVRSCVARQFTSWALRRSVTNAEYCAVRNRAAPFFSGPGALKNLITALISSDGFARPHLAGKTP
jgi:Protein of unknown function (DUF1588)/Protein of unknown function (DUF1592)/Protein of unknown function (DUF1595)/Protein of unknown function (DUF1585)